MDYALKDVTVQEFQATLDRAAGQLETPGLLEEVQPASLREPLALWFRAVAAQARWEDWGHLLGRPIVAVWNAALAVLDEE